ncbi:elongation factor P [Buchnera aphidicola (Ceratoglyphina bambusae)]|uniref:elongation factor P n=1 Tax=Buchnera aphidicola TaxID=9 RepID=UPI0031B802F8
MIFCNSNNFKNGLKIIFNKVPFNIEHVEFVKPGKGQTFIRTKIRNLINNRLLEKTLRSNENFELADIENIKISFLYKSEDTFYFMNLKNYDQISTKYNNIKNVLNWILQGEKYSGLVWNKNLISVIPKKFMNFKIYDFEKFSKNNVNSKNKLAILKNGIKICVPLFIKINDIIKIDTKNSKYVSRVKQ